MDVVTEASVDCLKNELVNLKQQAEDLDRALDIDLAQPTVTLVLAQRRQQELNRLYKAQHDLHDCLNLKPATWVLEHNITLDMLFTQEYYRRLNYKLTELLVRSGALTLCQLVLNAIREDDVELLQLADKFHYDFLHGLDCVAGHHYIHHAARDGRFKCLSFLLAHGFDLNTLDASGNTIAHYAAQESDELYQAIRQQYKGIDLGIKNTAGYTAEDVARDRRAREIELNEAMEERYLGRFSYLSRELPDYLAIDKSSLVQTRNSFTMRKDPGRLRGK